MTRYPLEYVRKKQSIAKLETSHFVGSNLTIVMLGPKGTALSYTVQ